MVVGCLCMLGVDLLGCSGLRFVMLMLSGDYGYHCGRVVLV